jgi:hypothetical protein
MNDVENKTMKNGRLIPKYVLLDEDPSIAGQRFSCMSFICRDILKRREQYMFDEFVRQWDMRKSMDKFAEFASFRSSTLNVETVWTTTSS